MALAFAPKLIVFQPVHAVRMRKSRRALRVMRSRDALVGLDGVDRPSPELELLLGSQPPAYCSRWMPK